MKKFLEISLAIEKDDDSSITEDERDKIMDSIIDLAESMGCSVGGNFGLNELVLIDKNGVD